MCIRDSYMIHISLMKTTSPLPGPVKVALKKLGADISDARKRRRVPTTRMAERDVYKRQEFGWRIANSEENFFLFIWEKSS